MFQCDATKKCPNRCIAPSDVVDPQHYPSPRRFLLPSRHHMGEVMGFLTALSPSGFNFKIAYSTVKLQVLTLKYVCQIPEEDLSTKWMHQNCKLQFGFYSIFNSIFPPSQLFRKGFSVSGHHMSWSSSKSNMRFSTGTLISI